jgi:periplasmic divalent cation tolerance protein
MSNKHQVVLCTAPDEEVASQLANSIVTGKLAACVSILPNIQSIYTWEGKVESNQEILLIIKSTAASYKKLEAHIKELHPYDCPEIIGLPIKTGSEEYLSWLTQSVS